MRLLTDGVRSGDPMADLFFNFAFRSLLRDLDAAMTAENLIPTIEGSDSPWHSDGGQQHTRAMKGPTWVDDHVALVAESDCHCLVQKIRRVAEIFGEVATSHGHTTNFAAGKTEVVIWWRGKNARQARAGLDIEEGIAVIPLDSGHKLRVVRTYKHIGVAVATTGGCRREAATRRGGVQALVSAIGRKVLGNRALPERSRKTVAAGLVDSKVFSGTGAWTDTKGATYKTIDATRAMALRQILWKKGDPPDNRSGEQLCKALGIPATDLVLRTRRLRLLPKISLYASDVLRALLQEAPWDKGWKAQIWGDLRWLRDTVSDRLGQFPQVPEDYDPEVIPCFEKVWTEWPKQWGLLVGLAQKRTVISVPASEDPYHEGGDTEPPVLVPAAGAWSCEDCGKSFTTCKGLKMHRSKMHADRPWYTSKIDQTVCPCCGWNFWSTWRLKRHVRCGPLACQLAARALPDLQQEVIDQVAASEREARKTAKRRGTTIDEAALPALPGIT
jgi:hypothetical protein